MSENRILFVNGQVFDGTGGPTGPGDVVVRGDRIESVRPGGGTETEPGDVVVDCAGAIPDVVYGDVPGYRPLELDLYLPEAASPVPVIVHVHGGGWRRGYRHHRLGVLGFMAPVNGQPFPPYLGQGTAHDGGRDQHVVGLPVDRLGQQFL